MNEDIWNGQQPMVDAPETSVGAIPVAKVAVRPSENLLRVGVCIGINGYPHIQVVIVLSKTKLDSMTVEVTPLPWQLKSML